MTLSPVSLILQAPPASKQANNTAPKDLSFKQMLERQAANRSDTSPTKKISAETNKDTKKTPDSTAKTSGSDAVPTDAGNEADKPDDLSSNPTDATPPATAELLALVANLRQPAEKLDDTPLDKDGLAKVDDGLDPVIGKRRAKPVPDRALLGNTETQDLQNDGAGKPAPDVIQGLNKKDDARLLTDAVTIKKPDFQSTTIAANMVASQAIAQEIGQATANPAADKLSPAVGSNAWNQALGQKITIMVGATQQTATLSLNPPDLGPLQVVLNINKESADATFIAAQPEVRQALEAALPKLREMLQEAGIQLGQANVSSNMPDRQSTDSGSGGRMGAQDRVDQSDSEEAPAITLSPGRTIRQGLVDAFA
ncbi:MAG: flagellar hook-length control protein FliK [Burkholderiaceae bacterium]